MSVQQVQEISLRFRDPSPSPERVGISSDGAYAERVVLPRMGAFDFSLDGSRHYIALHDLVNSDGELSVAGDAAIQGKDLRRTLTFVPRGAAVVGWSDPVPGRHSFIAVHFDESLLPPALTERSPLQRPDVYFRSRDLEGALQRLGRALSQGEPFLPILGSTLCQLMATELLAREMGRVAPARAVRGLGSVELERVRALMEEGGDADLSLDELAAAAGQSKYHFVKAFKASTGMTPYRALLERRIAKAADLLRSGVTAQSAASRLGFTTPAEFSRAFKRRMGCTPSDFKRAIGLRKPTCPTDLDV